MSKAKSGQRLKAMNIILADYLQMTASKLINRTSNINEIGELIDMITDAKRFISGKEEIDIRGADNLQRDLANIIGSYTRLENNSIARFTALEMAGKHNARKDCIIENAEYKNLPVKLFNNIEKLLNTDKGCTFWEFTHGPKIYRLIKTGAKEYTLSGKRRKHLNEWRDRSVFSTEKK